MGLLCPELVAPLLWATFSCSPQPHTSYLHSHYWGSVWILLLSAMFSSSLEVMCRDEKDYAVPPEAVCRELLQIVGAGPHARKGGM